MTINSSAQSFIMQKCLLMIFSIILLNSFQILSFAQDKEKAQYYIEEANNLYQKKKYFEAIELYEKGYNIFSHPSILFSIGKCYEYLKKYNKAIYYFELSLNHYKKEHTNPPEIKIIEEAIKSIHEKSFLETSEDAIVTDTVNDLYGKQGCIEYGGSLSFSYLNTTNGTSTNAITIGIQGSLLPFLSDGFALGVTAGIIFSSIEGTDSTYDLSLLTKMEYNFLLQNLYPFIGPEIGFFVSDSGQNDSLKGVVFGIGTGIKMRTGNNSLIKIGFNVRYQKPLNNNYDNYNLINFLSFIGFSLF